MQFQLNLSLIAGEIILILISSLIFLVDRFIKNKVYAFVISLLTLVFLNFLIFFIPFGKFTYSYSVDFYSSTVKLFLIFGSILLVFVYYNFLQDYQKLNYGEVYALTLFSLLGASIAVSAMDFVTLYLGIELLSIPVYFLIATNAVYDKKNVEGALKYFVVGCLSSVLLWLAIGIVYYQCGTLEFKEVLFNSAQLPNKNYLVLAVLILIAGFSIKMALVPFHMWAPDAYQASPIPITAFIAGIMKLAVLSALVKVLMVSFTPVRLEVRELLIPIVLLTILVGNVMAIKQDHIVRMLAYSSVAHSGYAFLGLISAEFYGYAFAIFYMVIYLFTTIGIFAVLTYLTRLNQDYMMIPNLSGLSKALPMVSFLMLVFLFSLAGIPPTAGFMAKFYLFLSLIKGGQIIVAILAIVFSVIGAYPYLRVLKVIYMDPLPAEPSKVSYGLTFFIPSFVTLFLIIILGVFPDYVSSFILRTFYLYISLLYFHF
jgi:NADH-quinone oxidoreductase subunit N